MSKNLLLRETKKLHYGKYLYKLKIYNQLAGIFRTELQRNGKLNFARTKLQEYLSRVKKGETVTKTRWRTEKIIRTEDILDANLIYLQLKNSKEYIVRCEYNTLIIYTNDRKLLLDIANKSKISMLELWEPDPSTIAFLQDQSNVILSDVPVYFPYKVTFGRKRPDSSLSTWIEKNRDKVQAGPIFMENLQKNNSIQGQYLYARDEHIVFLLQMLAGDNIVRIDKLIYKGDIDK